MCKFPKSASSIHTISSYYSSVSVCLSLIMSVCWSTQFWKAICLSKIYVCRLAHSASNMISVFVFMSFTCCHFSKPCPKSNSNFLCIYRTNQNICVCVCVLLYFYFCEDQFESQTLRVRTFSESGDILSSLFLYGGLFVWGLRLCLMAEVSIRLRLKVLGLSMQK